jgi:hypothetical protein
MVNTIQQVSDDEYIPNQTDEESSEGQTQGKGKAKGKGKIAKAKQGMCK